MSEDYGSAEVAQRPPAGARWWVMLAVAICGAVAAVLVTLAATT